mgnify:CR=1 FL=1
MFRSILPLALISLLIFSCTSKDNEEMQSSTNPLLKDYNTPFNTPPFEKIKTSHFKPAYERAISQARIEIQEIANNKAQPTFSNTIVALEKSGELLEKVNGVFYNLTSAHTNDSLTAIDTEISPQLAELSDDKYLDPALFERVKSLWDNKDNLNLNDEQGRLLKDYYQDFIRSGANLSEKDQKNLREINQELSVLTIQFGDNIRKENNAFQLVIEDEEQLSGLPEGVVQSADETAKEKGLDNAWVFTLNKPSLIPFLQYSDRRELRKEIFNAYINRGNNGNELDNKDILKQIVNLRVKKAQLLGYDNYADYVLEDRMASNYTNVNQLLDQIWEPALEVAKNEAAQMQELMVAEGVEDNLKPWDWWYYAEKIRLNEYNLDESEIRPYFQLENVRAGAFQVANKLFGITFEPRDDIQVYHQDVEVFEVKDQEGGHIGIFYTDFFPRESKGGGAWMNEFRGQKNLEGIAASPIITNVCNFTKPSGDTPSLLSFEEVQTLFHEFGHALHGLLSDVTYPRLAGTSVARDFVEFPSQIMENWASDPEVMKLYARHYQTGEVIPDELIEKLLNASQFNQGFATVEYLAASYLDLKWHTLEEKFEGDVLDFENSALDELGLIPEIVSRYRTPYFNHIFSSGYASGYYSYIWSGVLDSDGFAYFKETDVFDPRKAEKLKKYVYSAGNTADPMELYKKFRGREPDIEALLKKRGLDDKNKLENLL